MSLLSRQTQHPELKTCNIVVRQLEQDGHFLPFSKAHFYSRHVSTGATSRVPLDKLSHASQFRQIFSSTLVTNMSWSVCDSPPQ